MNSNNNLFSEPTAAVINAPFSERFIAEIRKDAEIAAWPRSKLLMIQTDILAADRAAHQAQICGDREALNRAILARCEAGGRLEDEYKLVADTVISLLSIAVDRQPETVANILSALPPSTDIIELADAVVDLQTKETRQ